MKECLGEEKPRKKNSKKSKVEVSYDSSMFLLLFSKVSRIILLNPHPLMMRVLSTLLISSGVVYSDKVPSQIHLALGPTPDSMGVQWSSDSADSTVKYRKANSENDWSLVHGKTFPFMDGGEEKYNQTHHVARMVDLEPSTPYEYKVGSSADGWSEKFTFSATPTTDSAKYPIRFGVWGDMGSKDNGAAILNEVTDVVDNGHSFDMILHVGDFAYNMDNNNGKLGDDFMNDIQHIATQIPYMVCVGNHEVAYDFSHYTERFRVVGDSFAPASYPTVHSGNGEGFNNWFYSHDFANVHFVAISTEIYFDYADTDLLAAQWNFVKDDLEKVDRKKTPWVVVHGHRPCYCSCDDDCDDAAALVRDGVEGQFGLEVSEGIRIESIRFDDEMYTCPTTTTKTYIIFLTFKFLFHRDRVGTPS